MKLHIETIKTHLHNEIVKAERTKLKVPSQRITDLCNGAIFALKGVLRLVERMA